MKDTAILVDAVDKLVRVREFLMDEFAEDGRRENIQLAAKLDDAIERVRVIIMLDKALKAVSE